MSLSESGEHAERGTPVPIIIIGEVKPSIPRLEVWLAERGVCCCQHNANPRWS